MNDGKSKTRPELYLVNDNRDAKAKKRFDSDIAPASILHIDKAGFLRYANDKAKKKLTISNRHTLNDLSLFDIDRNLTSDLWLELLEALSAHTAISYDCEYSTVSGGSFPVRCLAEHQLGATLLTIYFYDISERVFELEELKRKVFIFESFLNTPFLDINIKDNEGYYIACSEKFEQTFGFEKGYAIGKKPHDIYPVEFAEHVTNHDDTVRARRSLETQVDIVPDSDKNQTLLVQKFPTFHGGEVSGIGVVAIDVSTLSNSERKHAETSDRLADYVELTDDCFFEMDDVWRIKQIVGNYRQFFPGLDIFAGNSFTWLLLNHTTEKKGLQFYFSSLKASSKNNIDITIILPDQSEVSASLNIKVILDSDQQVISYRGMLGAGKQ